MLYRKVNFFLLLFLFIVKYSRIQQLLWLHLRFCNPVNMLLTKTLWGNEKMCCVKTDLESLKKLLQGTKGVGLEYIWATRDNNASLVQSLYIQYYIYKYLLAS